MEQGTWRVLEDNLRCPSGVALLPGKPAGDEADVSRALFRRATVSPNRRYPLPTCSRPCTSRPWTDTPKVVLSRQGVSTAPTSSNSSWPRARWASSLVEGGIWFCENNRVWMRQQPPPGAGGMLIYRRIDDDF